MKSDMRSLTVAFAAAMLCLAGCQGCADNDAEKEAARLRDKYADKDITYGGLPEPSEEEIAIMTEGVQAVANTTNSQDWEGHADLIHPTLFKTPESKQQMIEAAANYSNMGWMNTYEKWEIQNFSPYVPYEGGQASLVNLDMRLKVWFTDDWTGKPENYYNTIRDSYPMQEVVWNEQDSTYVVNGKMVLIAMHDDSLDRYFYIQRKAMNEPAVTALFKPESIQLLASFER